MFQKDHDSLLRWYSLYGRKDLPWRNLVGENAAYGVYVSEIMLQQTRVNVVLDYFYRFMQKFPTFKDLSLAKEDEVLVLWRGLGYYSRAKNLLKSAQNTQGNLPKTFAELKALSGIGDYTAGAILCFGYHQAVGFYDTNIKRFLVRYFGLQSFNHKILKEYTEKFLNFQNPFDHNQALLDLGALVCTAKSPKCYICPLNNTCKGKKDPLSFVLHKKIEYENLILRFGIYQERGGIAMFRDKKWNNLYSFPEILASAGEYLGSVRHTRTKYKIQAEVYKITTMPKDTELIRDFEDLPMSSLGLKILKLINRIKK
ncbi:A/G-specific adenine glycosylase [Helicobacter sp. faydin-H20]|uniref:A/G-specific adenine glycosylase n=1 Tax=Helicobacter anatolicus TaxID=2905874 RepID=UPI001E2B7056|nr:A/G-specific adenine glycosylase [Helicobacter anatolicus]MCE3037316.1 A/G-specific adenine glycosylase [Helicobacter anatolicus]